MKDDDCSGGTMSDGHSKARIFSGLAKDLMFGRIPTDKSIVLSSIGSRFPE